MAQRTTYTLDQTLLLNSYFLALFGCKTTNELYLALKSPELEGASSEGVSFLCSELTERIASPSLTAEQLLEYDAHIRTYTDEINEERITPIKWKYFQYLALLFTEIYLDRYIGNADAFCKELNTYRIKKSTHAPWHMFDAFKVDEMNKLAFWCATGSGKTLMMHIHLKQYLYYCEKYGRKTPDRTLLITPNEALTKQHQEEYKLSGIQAEVFAPRKTKDMFVDVELLEITKLAEENGEKTVAVSCFEGNNLVFVDEAHKGSSGETWWDYRERVTRSGFSFEYSATFGQAVASQKTANDRAIRQQEYGKCVLFNYSYRYFYNDGYGKDYAVLNLNRWYENAEQHLYLTAYLMSLYEQTVIYESDVIIANKFLIDRPLGVFVGTSVNAQSSGSTPGGATTDVIEILLFLRAFIENKADFSRYIAQLLRPTEGVKDKDGHSLFAKSFVSLKDGMVAGGEQAFAEQLYDKMRSKLFYAENETATLSLDLLKGATEEIGLRVGDNRYFGVINIGNNTQFIKTCREMENPFDCHTKDFSMDSLFASINDENSTITMLIGAKKFNTGWNSYRVSVMGLMKIGQTEGSDIIQMFGRGVRLRGFNHSLKRSKEMPADELPENVPQHLKTVETLFIFGVRADYMKVFDDATKANDIPDNSQKGEAVTIDVPVKPLSDLPKDLKSIRIKDNSNFRKQELTDIAAFKDSIHVELDMYATANASYSDTSASAKGETARRNKANLTNVHLAFVNWDDLYFRLVDMVRTNSWYNMMFTKASLMDIMSSSDWYDLYIPEQQMEFHNFGTDVRKWQFITWSLLKAYIEKVYGRCKRIYDDDNVERVVISDDDSNFIQKYTVQVREDKTDEIVRIRQLVEKIEDGTMAAHEMLTHEEWFQGIRFDKHLYMPLLYMTEKDDNGQKPYVDRVSGLPWLRVTPQPLNDGEKQFVDDLRQYCENHAEKFAGKELFLLRNQSRKGVGFFTDAGFYPDFIMWIKDGKKQYVVFLDPKGIVHLPDGIASPKILLYKRLKEKTMPRLKDKNLVLDSFILSVSPYNKLRWNQKPLKQTMQENHVLFMSDEGYLDELFESCIND